jgi:sulfate transport system permease protein
MPSRQGPRLLVLAAVVLTALFIVTPLIVIFAEAFGKGWEVYVANITAPDTKHAILLTILVAIVVVPINMAFGLAAAWVITRFRFPGKKLLLTLIEVPFSVSPIVAGVTYILLYGGQGLLGPLLDSWGLQIMFSVPAIILVTLFITSPFVARELIPLMQAQGSDQEEAAATLGASGWQIFRRVTLPNIRWALLYGAVLCSARAIGEFGGVSVVSGNVRGETNTLPLQVELLYHDYNTAGAFAAASTLALIAVITLALKAYFESRAGHRAAL